MLNRLLNNKNVLMFLVLIFIIEGVFGVKYLYRFQTTKDILTQSDIFAYSDYLVDNDRFVPTGNDSQVYFNNSIEDISSIRIVLNEPMEKDTNLQIFYAVSLETLKEENSCVFHMNAGQCSYKYDVSIPEAKILRFDIDGSFGLKKIIVQSKIRILSLFRVLVCILLNVFLVILVFWKKERIADIYNACIDKVFNISNKLRIHLGHVFLIFAIVMGITFAFLVPPSQIPDEFTHIAMMEGELGLSGYADEVNEYYTNAGLRGFVGNTDVKVDRTVFNEHKSDHFKNTGIVASPSITIVKHFPVAIGFVIGAVLGLPIYSCLMMGEIFSVLFFALMGFFAIRLMPVKKELLCAIMLLPMTLHQCSSYNYDSVLLPCVFFLTAYILHFVYGNDIIKWKNIVLIMVIALAILIIKMLYTLLLLLLLLVPKDNWGLKIYRFNIVDWISRHRIISIIIGLAVMSLGLYIIRDNLYIRLVCTCLNNPGHYLEVIINTIIADAAFYYRTSLGVFGCLDTYASESYYVIILCTLLLLSQTSIVQSNNSAKRTVGITLYHRLVYILVGLSIFFLIITVMVGWEFFLSGYHYETAGMSELAQYFKLITKSTGTQGRYLIPVMIPVFLAIHGLFKFNKKNLLLIQAVYYPLIFVWSSYVIYNRFWY